MAVKSTNTQGNPYHDEETGEFTSAENSGEKKSRLVLKPQYRTGGSESEGSKLHLKSEADLSDLKARIEAKKAVYDMPFFGSAIDIENNIDRMFIEPLVKELDANYNYSKNSRPFDYSPFKFNNGESGLRVNMFVQLLSHYRYPQKYCETIDKTEFDSIVARIKSEGSGKFTQYGDYRSMASSNEGRNLNALANNPDLGCGFVLGYRGISFGGYDWKNQLNQALNSYIGYHTTGPVYGGQGCYGTVNYVAMSQNYARSYDGSYGHIMKHIINVGKANIMYQPQVEKMQRDLLARKDNIRTKLESHFAKYLPEDRAQKLAQGVIGSIQYDFGMTCVLMGGDVVIAGIGNGNQIDILNWGVARILKDW